jgi:hypothetical protein
LRRFLCFLIVFLLYFNLFTDIHGQYYDLLVFFVLYSLYSFIFFLIFFSIIKRIFEKRFLFL